MMSFPHHVSKSCIIVHHSFNNLGVMGDGWGGEGRGFSKPILDRVKLFFTIVKGF